MFTDDRDCGLTVNPRIQDLNLIDTVTAAFYLSKNAFSFRSVSFSLRFRWVAFFTVSQNVFK